MADLKRPPWTPEQTAVLNTCQKVLGREPRYSDRVNSKGQRVLKFYSSHPAEEAEALRLVLAGLGLPAKVFGRAYWWGCPPSPPLIVYAGGEGAVRPSCLPESVLRWQDGTVPRLAKQIRKAKDYALMGVLADALMDAGCDDEKLMADCRRYAAAARLYAERWALRAGTPRDQDLPPWDPPVDPSIQSGKILKAILGVW